MQIRHLTVKDFRNLGNVRLSPSPAFNLFFGDNGAGKTSLLEAIHVLSLGHSFRSGKPKELINHQSDAFVVSAEFDDQDQLCQQGIQRTAQGISARINRAPVKSVVELSANFPVLAVHPDTFSLLPGEPAIRRGFLDWGLFYAEETFLSAWKTYRKALRQRNAALRQKQSIQLIQQWDSTLADTGEIVAKARQAYLEDIGRQLLKLIADVDATYSIEWRYRSGWSQTQSLAQALMASVERDQQLGFTYAGPHRGDFSLSFDQKDVVKYASRGQIKQITLLLKLAQAHIHVKKSHKQCILLLDDLPSELDRSHLDLIINTVKKLGLQTFITGVEPLALNLDKVVPQKMFHVKQGIFRESTITVD